MRRTQVRRQFAEGNEGSLRRPSATLLVEQGHTCVRTSEQAGLPERKLRKWINRVSGHSDLCISRMELEVILGSRHFFPAQSPLRR